MSAADNNAPTPRTDANAFEAYQWDGSGYGEGIFISVGKAVPADVARTIERELAASEAANRKASEDAILMRDGLLKQLAAKDETITGLRGLDRQNESIIAAKDREIADFNERINHTGEGNYLVHENAYLIDQKLAIEWACRAVNLPLSEWRSLLPAVEGLRARAEKAEAELARLKSENESLRTLWTEARDVVTQGRNANCVVSYGKAQCDAVAAANAWLDKMPATVKRTIDDASNTEWQLQRVTAERDQLRAEVERLNRIFAPPTALNPQDTRPKQ